MCVTSAVIGDWTHPTWPDYGKAIPATPMTPNAIPWPVIQNDPTLAKQLLEVLKRLEAIDKRLDLLEQCKVTEPGKEQLRERLRQIADQL